MTKNKKRGAPMIQIGVDQDSIRAARDAILSIIKSGGSDPVLCAALESLRTLCKVNATVSNCTFTG